MENILQEIRHERAHQDRKFGGPKHDDQHNTLDWSDWVSFYSRRLRSVTNSIELSRRTLIKIAALCVAAVESIDRRIKVGDTPNGSGNLSAK